MRVLIAVFKLFLFFLLCLGTLPVVALGYFLIPNQRLFQLIPFGFHRLACFIFRIKITTTGKQSPVGTQTVYVGNHLSYADIPVLGSFLYAFFISKGSVAGWPLLGTLAKLSHTVFIGRSRSDTQEAIKRIEKSLLNGKSFILFPEGTSTNGADVLPFKSSSFDIFLREHLKENLLIQPFTIALIDTNNTPLRHCDDRDIYCWYGDMDFMPHIWTLAKSKGARLHITLHPAKAAKDYDDRKTLAHDCHTIVQKELSATIDKYNLPR